MINLIDFNKILNNRLQKDLLEILVGLMRRLGANKFKKAINRFLEDIQAKMDFKKILNNEAQDLINLIYFQEEFVGGAFKHYKKIQIRRFKYVTFHLLLLFWS